MHALQLLPEDEFGTAVSAVVMPQRSVDSKKCISQTDRTTEELALAIAARKQSFADKKYLIATARRNNIAQPMQDEPRTFIS